MVLRLSFLITDICLCWLKGLQVRKMFCSLIAVLKWSAFTYLSIKLKGIETHYISGVVQEDVGFYFSKLSEYPSRLATIKISVNYTPPITFYSGLYMNIYTVKENINQQKQCTELHYGQFLNDKMIIRFNRGRCKEMQGVTYCNDRRRIQDYIPRNYYISFGYDCGLNESLKGLTYKITIYGQANRTKCSAIKSNVRCSKYYPSMSWPTIVGSSNPTLSGGDFQTHYYLFTNLLGKLCYKHVEKFICYLLFPKCVDGHQMITVCRETCADAIDACVDDILFVLRNVTAYDSKLKTMKERIESIPLNSAKEFCNYLPSANSTVPCFYEPVTCDTPPKVKNAEMQNEININKTYLFNSKVTYSCKNETQVRGNNTIACLQSGGWSKPPLCHPKLTPEPSETLNHFFVVVSVLVVPCVICIITCGLLRYKRRRTRKNPLLFRNKTFDAFVCYCYEKTDAQFAENTLRIELEENFDPPFKLCIHRRNFQAAWDIMWNINNAIKNSNSAIIVMSQDYVDSLWCKEEFEQCYMEHMKDPAFKLFVIMMQSADSLENTSLYMDSFFDHKTYLERNDVKLFKKISDYLSWVKEPKHVTTFTCMCCRE